MVRYRILLSMMILALSLAQFALAEEPLPPLEFSPYEEDFEALYGDEEFVSIATGSSKPITKAPAVASVITAEDIKAMGATTLDQVLETVPGLHVSLSTQGRLDSVYSIRGIHTKFNPQVLVLMNGIPFPFFTGGRPFHFQLPVASIARVEVIRGPGSAVYGADAYAGVINIITKDASDINGTGMGIRAGSFDTQELWLLHGQTYNEWDVAFTLEWQTTDGDNDRRVKSDFQTVLDTPSSTNFSLAPGALSTRYELLDTHLEIKRGGWRLRHWWWHMQNAGVGAGGALALDPAGEEDFDQHLVDLTYQTTDLVPDWDLSANLNYLYFKNDSQFTLLPPGTTVPIGSDGNLDFGPSPAGIVTFTDGLIGNPSAPQENLGLDLVAIYTKQRSHRWRFGTGAKRNKIWVTEETKNFGPGIIDGTTSPVDGTLTDVADTPHVFLPDKSRTAWYLSIQDEWQFAPDWELTGGIRYDHYSDFGGTVNPRLALVWSARHNLTAKLLYGQAFRAPSFIELYSINNPVALGNPDLDPETIHILELAFDYRPTFDLQTNLNIFTYRADDLIEFLAAAGGTKTAQNARDQEGYGFELEMAWDATEDLRLGGNYAWQHSEDPDTGKRIPDAPGQQLLLYTDWKFLPGWSVRPQLNWVANRKRAEADTRSEIDDYTLVDLTLRRTGLKENWEFAVAARNIFDEDAREPSSGPEAAGLPISIPDDYPLEGRSLWAEVRYRF